jgi:glyoxylase-like metal-dependent hydrolase (beta-lactamase superfamily II)
MQDKVLYAGDNLERPAPFILCKDLHRYVNTLQEYLETDADVVIGGHTGCEDKKLVSDNLEYVKKVLSGEDIESGSEDFNECHKANMKYIESVYVLLNPILISLL